VNILSALRREEAKFRKQLKSTQQQLERVRSAMKALGGKTDGGKTKTGRRKMSAAVRAKIRRAQLARWKKFREENK
jgi:hypothetical protein